MPVYGGCAWQGCHMSGLNLTVIWDYSCTEYKFPKNLFQRAHNILLLKRKILLKKRETAWRAPWSLIWHAVRVSEGAGSAARTVTGCSLLSPVPRHLPAYLVAAFIKRLSRLALTAPPEALLMIIPFICNLFRRHPACRVLVHRPGGPAGKRGVVLCL